MTKRKKTTLGNLDDVLGGQAKPKSDEIKQPESSRADDKKSISYRLGLHTKERVSRIAERFNVQKSDLVHYLLHRGLDELEAGEIELPTVEDNRPKKIGGR